MIDLCVILAGPTCGRLLRDFGAEVIKVDAHFWTRRPYIRKYGWLDLNRGKRSMIIDLKTESGREVFTRLLGTADVLIENYRLGKMQALGFGFDEVPRIRPGLVYTSLNAYDFGGPFSGYPGWDPNAQAVTGMETA